MNIIFMHRSVLGGTPVGYDIERAARLLSERHRCMLYANQTDIAPVETISRSTLLRLLKEKGTAVVYCHSEYWEAGAKLLDGFTGPLAIRYCGIAPEALYDQFDEKRYYQALLGRDQTRELLRRFPGAYWLCSSREISLDLGQSTRRNIGVCPPFTRVEERFGGVMPDEGALRRLIESTTCNLLYAGPIGPEYGLAAMLDILVAYRDLFSADIMLHLMSQDGETNAAYRGFLERRIAQYGLQGNVYFVPKPSIAEEAAHYLGCDAMLYCAQYDGFCQPIAAAQYFRLPLISMRKSSAPEAAGLNQLCLDDDPRLFAAAIDQLRSDGEIGRTLGRIGRKNFDVRLSLEAVSRAAKNVLERGLQGA